MKDWPELANGIFQAVLIAALTGGDIVMGIGNNGDIVFGVVRERI